MRTFLLLLSFFFIFNSNAGNTKKDSLYVESIRTEARSIRKENLIGSIERTEFAIAEAKLANLSELFINKRLRDFLANRYSNIGDFDRAIELTKNLESFFNKIGDLDNELEAKTNLGIYNRNIGRHNIAYHYFLEGWQTQKHSNETEDKLDWLDGLSASCIELGRLEEAEMYLIEARKLLNNYSSEWKDYLTLYYYINKSNYAFALGDEVQAEVFLLECVSLNEKLNDRKGADAYQLLANLSLKQGKNQQVLDYTEKIVKLLGADKDTFAKDPYLLYAYLHRAKAFLALSKYEKALVNCQKAEDQAVFLQRQYMFNESKLFIGELRRENLETGIRALHYLYQESGKAEHLEEALVYANRAKSNVLNERLVNSKILAEDDREDAISLRFKLIFQLNKLKEEEVDGEVIVLRNKLDSLNKVLGVKNETPFLSSDLKIFQSNLNKESICLEYIVIDTSIFRFDIQKDTIGWSVEVVKNSGVISNFYNILRIPTSTSQEFLLASSKLPALLPSQLLKDSTIREISIIPDGMLNYVIFDALPAEAGNGGWESIRYLAEDYSFSYHFSIQSAKSQAESESTNNYLGFAPDYSSSEQLATLKNSRQALEQAQDYFGGISHFGIQATKKKFQEFGPTADILHLYAHGVSNDSSYDASYLILQDDKMHVDEILALSLKAKLCFLTACEVGLGKEYKGEGITGIAWAFKAAGAENVIQSMWKLNEQSSSQLMSYFFDYLSEDINSSQSLTQAKREYLKSSEISNRLKHPYYWAGIGHYGNGATFPGRTQEWWNITLGFVLLLVVSLLGYKYLSTKGIH